MMKTWIRLLCALKLDTQSGAVLHETGLHLLLLLAEAREIERKILLTKEENYTAEIDENNVLETMGLHIPGG